ncbi:hypothetical protein ABZP36_012366 [Zizania latifolia]
MRCKRHPYANAVGVCAPCLRDRLLDLAAQRDHAGASEGDDDDDRASSLTPPPRGHHRDRGLFARSVSPYAAARRSDACAYSSSSAADRHQPSLLFFRTPQVGPSATARAEEPEGRKKVARRRSFLALIFGGGRHNREEIGSKDPPRRSTSWLSAIVRRKRRPNAATESLPPPLDEVPDSPGGSSSSCWFPSPSPARPHRRRHTGVGTSGDGISGFPVCLSPLVRPSSGGGRRRCQPPDPSSLGDSHRRHLSAGSAASFGRNTSRKLADMGSQGRFR